MTKEKNSSTTPEQAAVDNPQRRISLTTVFSGAFLSVLIIFILVIAMGFYRFSDFQSILSQLTAEALPEVTVSGKTYSKVNELTFLTERLATSPTQAFRRIAYQDIEDKIKQISDLGIDRNEDQFLKTQLQAISKEFDGLDLLVEKRIQFQNLVKSQESKMYRLHEEVLEFSTSANQATHNTKAMFAWALHYSEVVSLSGKALAMTRLNQIKQISIQIEHRLELLLHESKEVVLVNKANAEFLTRKLKAILIEEDGLLPIRMQEFRSIGQATGRSNFVRNLVGDYARQVQFYSYEVSEAVITETESTALRINQQTRVIGIAAIFAVLFLVAVVYFVQRKIIHRLVRLNHNVLLRLKGENLNLNLSGNDEISDIASSFNYFAEQIEKQKQTMQALSLTDGLTGIPNRRFLDERLETELQIAQRHKWPVSILVLDVDSFKDFNDHYGHLEGDDCLKRVAQTLSKCKQRNSDFVARFGGEEFVFILPDTSTKGAEQVAETILKAIYDLHITHEWSPAAPYITLSIGIASYLAGSEISEEQLLERADKALFQAKKRGKNCFVSFDENKTE